MRSKKKIILIGITVFIVLIIFFKSSCQISGNVIQVINECNSERPVIIMKALGVKHINSVKRGYDSDVFTDWEVNVDDNKVIKIEYMKQKYSTGDNWTLMGDSYKKINEIDPAIEDDGYAHYYYHLSKYATNLEENKIIEFDEIKNIANKTSLNMFEKSSGVFILMLPYLFIIIIILLVANIIKKSNKKKSETYNNFLKENNALYALKNAEYNFGIDNFIQGEICNVFVQNDNLKIVNLKSKNTANLKFSQIVSCGNFTDEEIQKQAVTKNGSVIGRGALGGFIFGPAGLILGGLSGVGAKNQTIEVRNVTYYFIINYKSKNSKETKSLSFKSNVYRNDFHDLEKELKKFIQKQDIDL